MREGDVKNRGNSFPTQGETWVARKMRACGSRTGESRASFLAFAGGSGPVPPTFRKAHQPKKASNPVPRFCPLMREDARRSTEEESAFAKITCLACPFFELAQLLS